MQKTSIGNTLQSLTAAAIITAFVALSLVFWAPGSAYAIDESEYEYEYYEGLHEEEWYDPSDWFDDPGEGISYETDWYDNTYGYGDYYDSGYDFDYGGMYGGDYGGHDYNYYTDYWYDEGPFLP